MTTKRIAWRHRLQVEVLGIIKDWNDVRQKLHLGDILELADEIADAVPSPDDLGFDDKRSASE